MMTEGTAGLVELGKRIPNRQHRFLENSLFRKVPRPQWSTANKILHESPLHRLRAFDTGHLTEDEPERSLSPVLVVPPEVNQSYIVDFHQDQSLVATIGEGGFRRVAAIDWKDTDSDTAGRDIDESVAAILESARRLGERVHLIGVCQGGWESAIAAAQEPERVASLTLVAAPIDFAAGKGAIRQLSKTMPITSFRSFVALGGGVMRGRLISLGFDSLMPFQRSWLKYLSLWNHLDDAAWMERFNRLDDWYRCPKNLPGPLYLRAVRELFKENRLIQGRFTCLGRQVDLTNIQCPLCLVMGSKDHITPAPQIRAARDAMGSSEVLEVVTPGGHIGAFMGRDELSRHWPEILTWLGEHDSASPSQTRS